MCIQLVVSKKEYMIMNERNFKEVSYDIRLSKGNEIYFFERS